MYIIPLVTYFPDMEGVAETIENCNVCMCILFAWSPISPTWMGSLQKWEFHCLYVHIIPLVTYFPKYEGGCSHKWELQCMYGYNIPLITNFANMAELLTEMRIAMSVYVYYSLGHVFPQTWRGLLTEMRIAMSACIYYSLDHLFPQHVWVAHRNENCNVCMCILFPSSPISPTWRGLLTEMKIAMYICILFPWSPIFPTWSGLLREIRIPMSVCVYYSLGHVLPQTWRGLLTEMRIAMSACIYYSFDHLFPQHGWLAHRNENCNVLRCILFP